METFFVLGTNHTLSIAEIGAVLGYNRDYSQTSAEILLLDESDVAPDSVLQDRLAGIIKTGEIIGSLPKLSKDKLADFLFSHCYQYDREGKVNFGISTYNLDNPTLAKDLQEQNKALGLEVKKRLKESGQSVRFVTGRDRALSSVIVKTNNLLESGGEFVLIATKDGIKIGQTRTVQDFKAWSDRDFGKPKRDPKRGMLPPKLARTMYNLGLGQLPIVSRLTLLDPFCGVGTVLIEATLLRADKIIGTDIDQKAINDSEKNLNWLGRQPEIELPDIHLLTCPIQKIDSYLTEQKIIDNKNLIDLVVTEPDLGPPQSGRETPQQLENTLTELASLYIEGFRSMSKLLAKNATICITFPVFELDKKKIFVPIMKELKEMGYSVVDPVPKSAPKQLNTKTPQNGILYQRPKHKVAREVLVFNYSP